MEAVPGYFEVLFFCVFLRVAWCSEWILVGGKRSDGLGRWRVTVTIASLQLLLYTRTEHLMYYMQMCTEVTVESTSLRRRLLYVYHVVLKVKVAHREDL